MRLKRLDRDGAAVVVAEACGGLPEQAPDGRRVGGSGRANSCGRAHSNRRRRAELQCPVRDACGFTLIELMVVLVIIGVLAALIVPNVLDRADDARATAAKTDVNNLMQALKLYKLDNQRYPTAEQGLQALVARPSAGPVPPNWKQYLEKLPNDPWGRPYQYLNPGVKGEIDVMSFGADGQPGGEGKNADVGSWQ
jgi:general secretion pathway protein G